MSAISVITNERLRDVVDEEAARRATRRAFIAAANGRVHQPLPMGFEIGSPDREVHVKAAAIATAETFAVKVATAFADNKKVGLAAGAGVFLVFDQKTGYPLALLRDDAYLTDLRTGAAGSLAVEFLAPESFDTLLIVGAGVQARFQLRAIAKVRAWRTTQVWARNSTAARVLCNDIDTGIETTVVENLEQAVRAADVIVTTTSSRQPLIRFDWLRSNATIVAVGADNPAKQELDAAILGHADKIVVDDKAQCAALGELHHALEAGLIDHVGVYAELGEVLSGSKPGREGREMIVCDLTGIGAQDAAIAERVWQALGGTSAMSA